MALQLKPTLSTVFSQVLSLVMTPVSFVVPPSTHKIQTYRLNVQGTKISTINTVPHNNQLVIVTCPPGTELLTINKDAPVSAATAQIHSLTSVSVLSVKMLCCTASTWYISVLRKATALSS